ncbi:hypothetical protein NDU88_009655 [Pleurodeles waltl]|uniref:Uncharacterized protein n=1 Tax=Pleurodeles waltl TaxID=8319 RepID=A0AAV7QS81_PLEWA|nr:hypothetical protein NDU88_009655 [Pleurodeles waltl]
MSGLTAASGKTSKLTLAPADFFKKPSRGTMAHANIKDQDGTWLKGTQIGLELDLLVGITWTAQALDSGDGVLYGTVFGIQEKGRRGRYYLRTWLVRLP